MTEMPEATTEQIRNALGAWKNPQGYSWQDVFDRWLDHRNDERDADLLRLVADDLIKYGPVLNFELNHDGTEDPLKSAYVEGQHDAWDRVDFMAKEAARKCTDRGTDD